jgi:predicted RNase H-like nuclease (RuvC/YqgF family)
LTTQCAQLDEANRAWQQFHQTQLDSFRNKLQNSLPIDNSLSLDDIAQHIVTHLDQQQNEHENLIQQLQTSEKLNNVLRSGKRFALLLYHNNNYFISVKNQPMINKQYNRLMLIQ